MESINQMKLVFHGRKGRLIIMTIEQIELEAFRQIRRKVRDFTDESSNDEIAGYVKGIVDLETELYSILLKEKQS